MTPRCKAGVVLLRLQPVVAPGEVANFRKQTRHVFAVRYGEQHLTGCIRTSLTSLMLDLCPGLAHLCGQIDERDNDGNRRNDLGQVS